MSNTDEGSMASADIQLLTEFAQMMSDYYDEQMAHQHEKSSFTWERARKKLRHIRHRGLVEYEKKSRKRGER